MTEQTSPQFKRVRVLAAIASELRQGKHFNVTRLTLLKSLCSDAGDAAAFAVYLARKSHQAIKASSKTEQQYQRLAGRAVRGMTAHLKSPTEESKVALRRLLAEVRGVQNEHEHQRWGPVRIIKSRQLLVVELALQCLLDARASAYLGYDLGRHYAERYDARYASGLIPASAPCVEDIAEFWGKRIAGRGWRKQLVE